jgi:transposase
MDADSGQKHDSTAARRGLIVQRVLVEGLTPDAAGAPFGIEGPVVAGWVAAYRRRGMASLRESGAHDKALLRLIEQCLRRIAAWLRGAATRPASRPAGGSGGAVRGWRRY